MKDFIRIGKKITYLLRHNPEDLAIDKQGYVNVLDLLKKVGITQEDLDYIVDTNDKKRVSETSNSGWWSSISTWRSRRFIKV